MSNTSIKTLAEQLVLQQGFEYQSSKYRSSLAYWLRRIRRELAQERR